MATDSVRNVNSRNVQRSQKTNGPAASVPIRVSQKSKGILEKLLKQANKDRVGRKVKADDVICFGLELISDDHMTQICNRTLSNKDRLEVLFQKFAKERRGATRDEFFGVLLDGKVTI